MSDIKIKHGEFFVYPEMKNKHKQKYRFDTPNVKNIEFENEGVTEKYKYMCEFIQPGKIMLENIKLPNVSKESVLVSCTLEDLAKLTTTEIKKNQQYMILEHNAEYGFINYHLTDYALSVCVLNDLYMFKKE